MTEAGSSVQCWWVLCHCEEHNTGHSEPSLLWCQHHSWHTQRIPPQETGPEQGWLCSCWHQRNTLVLPLRRSSFTYMWRAENELRQTTVLTLQRASFLEWTAVAPCNSGWFRLQETIQCSFVSNLHPHISYIINKDEREHYPKLVFGASVISKACYTPFSFGKAKGTSFTHCTACLVIKHRLINT